MCFGLGVTVSPSPSQVAVANLSEAVQDADLLVFVIPHQFIHRICEEITGRVAKDALGITLIKVTGPRCARLPGTSFPLSPLGDKELKGSYGWFGFVFLKMPGRESKPRLPRASLLSHLGGAAFYVERVLRGRGGGRESGVPQRKNHQLWKSCVVCIHWESNHLYFPLLGLFPKERVFNQKSTNHPQWSTDRIQEFMDLNVGAELHFYSF